MKEHKLYHICIFNKTKKDGTDAYNFRVVADGPGEALTKLMNDPDVDFLYVESLYEISIQYKGVVY